MEKNLGKVAITPKGTWEASTAYEQLDMVSYDGGSWLAKKPSTNITPADGEYWMEVAEKGSKGDKGDVGTVEAASGLTVTGDASISGKLSVDGYTVYSEKPFQLIETITFTEEAALERTTKPDGTAYNFREVYLKIARSDTTAACSSIGFRAMNGSAYLGHSYCSFAVGAKYDAIHFYTKNGYWFGERLGSSSDSMSYGGMRNGGASFLMDKTVASYPAITRLYSYMTNIPTGTIIAIWAVEA